MDKQLVEQVVRLDGCRCRACGKTYPLDPPHHIILKSQGGTDDLWNLITLCMTCHNQAHNGKGKGADRQTGRQVMISILKRLRTAIDYRWEPAYEVLRKKVA